MFEMHSIDECVAAKQREMDREGLAEEILSSRLLPRFGAALRRLRAQRAGKAARARQYQKCFELFSDLCADVLGYVPLPAEPEVVALFLTIMVDNGETPQRIRDMAAISWVHRNAKMSALALSRHQSRR